MKAGPAAIGISLCLAGCGTIDQQVKPVALSSGDSREICVIENASVRQNFLEAYKNALTKKGLSVRVLPEGSSVGSCLMTSTYTATWRWDLALYLAYTDLKVYRNSRLVGEALYNAEMAAADTNKFIVAETKIQELTNKLFPT